MTLVLIFAQYNRRIVTDLSEFHIYKR